MSIPEREAACLAAYNPRVFDIHEQRMLFTTETLHPMAGLYPERANEFPIFKGTVEVADRLGYLDLHPTLRCDVGGEMRPVPWPYQGDLLLFIDRGDDAFCVNWPVKDTRQDFLGTGQVETKSERRRSRKKRARHETELGYYWDAAIRSEAIAGEEIADDLSNNLLRLCCYAVRCVNLPRPLVEDVEGALDIALQSGYPPAGIIVRLCAKGRLTSEQGRIVFHQAIWNRRLRVDMFSPILIDRPMIPETTDVLDYYAKWFRQ